VRKPDFRQNVKNPQNQCIASEFEFFHKLEFDMFITQIKGYLWVVFMEKSATLHCINLTFIPRGSDIAPPKPV